MCKCVGKVRGQKDGNNGCWRNPSKPDNSALVNPSFNHGNGGGNYARGSSGGGGGGRGGRGGNDGRGGDSLSDFHLPSLPNLLHLPPIRRGGRWKWRWRGWRKWKYTSCL